MLISNATPRLEAESINRAWELQEVHNRNSLRHELDPPIKTGAQSPTGEAFYTYQKEPWLTEPGYESVTCREEYVSSKKSLDEINLALIQLTYTQFKDFLADAHPDIAKQSFGFTLGPDGNLKVINYSDALTQAECSTVNELMNNFQDLRIAIRHQAKDIMILSDHDHATFGSPRNISLENFHEIIDYHQILSRGKYGMQEEWIRQVATYAEPRSGSYISEEV